MATKKDESVKDESVKDESVKDESVKDESVKETPKSGLIAFIRDGVTVLRDASLIGELANQGWKVK